MLLYICVFIGTACVTVHNKGFKHFTSRVKTFFLFFFSVYFLHPFLFSLPPGCNSDSGSGSRLFSPPTHYGSRLALLSRQDFSSFFPRRLALRRLFIIRQYSRSPRWPRGSPQMLRVLVHEFESRRGEIPPWRDFEFICKNIFKKKDELLRTPSVGKCNSTRVDEGRKS